MDGLSIENHVFQTQDRGYSGLVAQVRTLAYYTSSELDVQILVYEIF